ncbi:DHHC zinc finger domain containing protein [Tritrichomonas foetus]|uniref:Palmitoyltransferase n=1 Tax=Tritrichomonas foetus TaxID=1144522 RepID=A0A1J4JH54_9EUKA|nr:DHHC zinc finger domain containing protein [Tritrichomonas foetus]|eukprot:OHS98041.1 DHHC zinc finger domain containing protein [Tritrichomonas foetus]
MDHQEDQLNTPILHGTDNITNNIADKITNDITQIEKTSWKIKHSCCCCGPYIELSVPNKKRKRHFLRHWEFKPGMPIFVILVILYTTITHFVCIFPLQYFIAQIISPFIIVFFLILFLSSYFGAVCMDPGFLPYNWIETKRFKYSWEEQLSGLAVTDSQFAFATSTPNRPPQCSFSHSAGRYVMRADHICGWVANWIGKRNHKQFMLMNLYGGFFSSSLVAGFFCVEGGPLKIDSKYLLPTLPAFCIELSFALTLFSMFATTLVDLKRNRAKIQKMRESAGEQTTKISMRQSMEEVCGSGSCCSWCIPTPAFDDTLILQYDPYITCEPDESDE